jgi:hypothetical protein
MALALLFLAASTALADAGQALRDADLILSRLPGICRELEKGASGLQQLGLSYGDVALFYAAETSRNMLETSRAVSEIMTVFRVHPLLREDARTEFISKFLIPLFDEKIGALNTAYETAKRFSGNLSEEAGRKTAVEGAENIRAAMDILSEALAVLRPAAASGASPQKP